jgi:hypothetical protein
MSYPLLVLDDPGKAPTVTVVIHVILQKIGYSRTKGDKVSLLLSQNDYLLVAI